MSEVEDFFRFIDVSDRHPFSGTGGLVKFAEGLAKIDVQNQVLFLFDNDAEGWAACEEVQKYRLPPNMRTMVLPELDEFRHLDQTQQSLSPGDYDVTKLRMVLDHIFRECSSIASHAKPQPRGTS